MSDLVFPKSLKPIISKGYSQVRGSNIWRADVQGGIPRQGRDTYYEPVPISVTLVVTALGRQLFWAFIAAVDGGASSFLMDHDTGNGIEEHSILITSNINDSTSNGVYWTITFTATAERTSIQDVTCVSTALLSLEVCYGRDLGRFIRTYESNLTSYPFINNLPSAT